MELDRMPPDCSCDCGISYVHDDFTLDEDEQGPFDCPVEECGGECGGVVDLQEEEAEDRRDAGDMESDAAEDADLLKLEAAREDRNPNRNAR